MKQLGDWRLPVIFAVPVLLWAALLWAVFQPLPNTAGGPVGAASLITAKPTPLPVASPVDILSTVPPTKPQPSTCAHQTVGYIVRSEGGVVVNVQPGFVCP